MLLIITQNYKFISIIEIFDLKPTELCQPVSVYTAAPLLEADEKTDILLFVLS